jgi:hypothetical protein
MDFHDNNHDITVLDLLLANQVTSHVEAFLDGYDSLDGTPVEALKAYLTANFATPDVLLDLSSQTLADRTDYGAPHGFNLTKLETLFCIALTETQDPEANITELCQLFFSVVDETLQNWGASNNTNHLLGQSRGDPHAR